MLNSFSDFKWENAALSEQTFEDYKSKYSDLHDKVRKAHQKETVSILEDVDFKPEIIHRDEINLAYILQLRLGLKSQKQKDALKAEQVIFNLLNTEATLRSKKELLKKFIQESLPRIKDADEVVPAFDEF